ncbi:MAG: hypothetical protein ACI97K_001963 [Glaciecola sp.]|jgi:hypothetical protein
MKWTTNNYQLKHSNTALKTIVSLLAVFTLMSCVTTDEFTAANDVNSMDNNLTTLLIDASSKNDTGEKKQIAFLAALAHESGDAMASTGSKKVALAYYRIAAVAYWRDDISSNDNKLLDVIDSAKVLCDTLKEEGKAPDRDCFVVQITLLLEVIEGKFGAIANIDQSDFTDIKIADVRSLIDELGYQANSNNAKSQGFFVTFVETIKTNAAFLKNHPTMKTYIVETLLKTTKQYKRSMSEIAAYYRKTNSDDEMTSLNATHPIFVQYGNRPEETQDKRIEKMIEEWLTAE